MTTKCRDCGFVNFSSDPDCPRCSNNDLLTVDAVSTRPGVLRRIVICIAVCIGAVAAFHFSLILTSEPLRPDERAAIERSISVLEERGFTREAFLLRRLAIFRRSDNWFNSISPKENAFAATNFPFEIVTLYPDLFTYPYDDVERAAILLHESRHLAGGDERDAYEFVWRSRDRLGWSQERYVHSPTWRNVRTQTREVVPHLFQCEFNEENDCTEVSRFDRR
ncbi:MAG: hypothetical protein KF736_10305 [Acidobacteria bacterium]|nr:hypothetical protein [Acidobacteriota bacterium]MCW5949749.1 hypothetical protein [Pyrinomonadaceae bacterium]